MSRYVCLTEQHDTNDGDYIYGIQVMSEEKYEELLQYSKEAFSDMSEERGYATLYFLDNCEREYRTHEDFMKEVRVSYLNKESAIALMNSLSENPLISVYDGRLSYGSTYFPLEY